VCHQPQHQAAWQHEHDLVEALVVLGHGREVLIQDGGCVQQPLVPLPADYRIGHGQAHVVHDGGDVGHLAASCCDGFPGIVGEHPAPA
jgi:hypothetical protein